MAHDSRRLNDQYERKRERQTWIKRKRRLDDGYQINTEHHVSIFRTAALTVVAADLFIA